MNRFMWWHLFLKHRMHMDIDVHRMTTVCDCGHTWVDVWNGGSKYITS